MKQKKTQLNKISDINECDQGFGCEQICNNLPGSAECKCHHGLQVDTEDDKKCIGKFEVIFKSDEMKIWKTFSLSIFLLCYPQYEKKLKNTFGF